jgi:hypothetical protein
VLFIYWNAYRSRRVSGREMSLFALVSFVIVLVAIVQFAVGLNTLVIACFGVRSYLLHLPLIFVMKDLLTLEDVKKIGRWFLIVSIPMTLLMTRQYNASPSSWLNVGAGGVSGTQITFTAGHVRASGTFSFVTGIADFYPLVAAFVIFAIAEIGTYSKWLLRAAIIANILAIPVSGSRTLLFAVGAVVAFGVLSLLSSGRSSVRLIQVGAVVVLAGAVCSMFPVFQDSLASFQERWSNAQASEGTGSEGSTEGTLKTRVLDSLVEPFEAVLDVPFVGMGIGAGSNVAAVAKTGEQNFTLAEGEWARLVQECGVFGFLFLGYRILLGATLLRAVFRLQWRNATLSLLLAIATLPQLVLNVIEQPTHQGFMAFGAGLCLASAKRRKIVRPPLLIAPACQQVSSARPPIPATSIRS